MEAISDLPRAERIELAPGYSVSRVINGCWQLSDGHALDAPIDFDDVMHAFFELIGHGFTTFDCGDIYTGVEEFLGTLVTHLKRSKGRTCRRHCDQVHPGPPERRLRHRWRAQQPPRLRQLQDLRVRTFSRGRCGHHGVPRRIPAPSGRLLYARARKLAIQEHHPHECERGGAGRKRRPGKRVEATALHTASKRAARSLARQYPDAHKSRGVLPEIGRFSSTGGVRRESSALYEKSHGQHAGIGPGQRCPIPRRLPLPPVLTTQVDENHPISGRSSP